ncbi:hypothetical protein C8Q80DRAFT_317551 [Daedaleopsis nitida]|nr:hypothetical protein C8Q80DRAFT_317551 [Daedaleopsis nitida]
MSSGHEHSVRQPTDHTVIIFSRSSLIIADAIVITTTWYTMYNTVQSRSLRTIPSFSRLFLVDGTIYFFTLLVLNVLDFILAILQIEEQEYSGDYVVIFVDVFTSILVSRFLLDLQAVKTKTQHQSSLDSTPSSVVFDRIMGSIDSELQPGDLQFLSGGVIEDIGERDPSGNGDSEEIADAVLSIGSSSPQENTALA